MAKDSEIGQKTQKKDKRLRKQNKRLRKRANGG